MVRFSHFSPISVYPSETPSVAPQGGERLQIPPGREDGGDSGGGDDPGAGTEDELGQRGVHSGGLHQARRGQPMGSLYAAACSIFLF